MIAGARQGKPNWLRRMLAVSTAHDLRALVVPGPEVAYARGLDLSASGLQLVVTPRHANVLLLVGSIPPALTEAATVLYAQMMRPRAIFALSGKSIPSLPADVVSDCSQQGLLDGVKQLRTIFTQGAFRSAVQDFHAPALEIRIEYTCPMHPEVIQDTPGACPKCGMTLVPRETQVEAAAVPTHHHHHHHSAEVTHTPSPAKDSSQYTCPMHTEVIQDTPGACPKCGMTLVPRETQVTTGHGSADHHHHSETAHDHGPHHHHEGVAPAAQANDGVSQYTCPMHPEVIQDTPGSCPKCGMTLVPRDQDDKHMDHDEMAFMSMVEVTKDLPRSLDGLAMDWIEVPFGPVFPGLPGGLLLNLTLDGDTVTKVRAESLVGGANLIAVPGMTANHFVEHLATMDPLAPMAYRLLACRGLEQAGGHHPDEAILCGRAAALEHERIASHLGWLAQLGRQTGLVWLEHHAVRLQRVCLQTDFSQMPHLQSTLRSFTKRLMQTPLLRARLAGIGTVTSDSNLRGPVARAAGLARDARSSDATYQALSFRRMQRNDGDAFDRLRVRLDEILHSIQLIQSAGILQAPVPCAVGTASGEGQASVETPRGEARLHLVLDNGQVSHAHLDTPSKHHVSLLPELLLQQELGDALTTVCSLDLSPWEFAA